MFSILILAVAVPSQVYAQISPDTKPFTYQNDVKLSVEYPISWDVVENSITSDLWIASIYDDKNDWKVQIDLSLYENDPILLNMQDDKIVEYTFLSYFYACNDLSFERIPFELLSAHVQDVVFENYQQKRGSFETQIELSEWWLTLRDSEIKKMFFEKGVFVDDYLKGFECTNFTPVDFKIFEVNGYKTFQYIYSWNQMLPDGNYFENVSVETELWIKDKRNYVVNVSSESTIENFNVHAVEFEDMIESVQIEILPKKNSLPHWVKIDSGLWALGNISDKKFKSSLGYIITEKIIDRPEIFGTKYFETTKFPEWLETAARAYAENKITEKEYVECIQYLVDSRIIHYLIDGQTN